MVYTEAVLLETLRISSVAAVGIPHMALEDAKLGKYTIPKVTSPNRSHIVTYYGMKRNKKKRLHDFHDDYHFSYIFEFSFHAIPSNQNMSSMA